MGRRQIIKVEGAWFQKIINPKAKAGIGLTALRVKGISIYGRQRKGWNHAAYIWMDIDTAIGTKIIPKEISNDENKINDYLKKFVIGEKIRIKGPKIVIKKEKVKKGSEEEQQKGKRADFAKEKAKILKQQKKFGKQNDFRKVA